MPPNVCQTCGAVQASPDDIFVYALPGIPMSVGNCRVCMEVNAYPWSILIANTAMIGGIEAAADWWKEAVQITLARLGKTRQEFLDAVTADLKAMEMMDVHTHPDVPPVGSS